MRRNSTAPGQDPTLRSLEDVLLDPTRFRFGDALYMDRSREFSLDSECLVWDVDDVIDDDIDLPEPAVKRGFDYVLDLQAVLSIVENIRAQRPAASTELLLDAFLFYWRHDAFIDVSTQD